MRIEKIINFLNKTKNNVWIIIIGTVLSWIIAMSADLSNVGLGGLAHLFFPIIIGIVTLLIYLILRIFTKKIIWVITILGTIYNLILAFQLYFDLI